MNRELRISIALFIGISLASNCLAKPVSYEGPARHYIPVEEARRLAYEAELKQYGDADAVIDFNVAAKHGDVEPDFYGFSAEFSGPVSDLGLGHYAVNRWTGDVWNVVGSVCHNIVSPRVIGHQEEIRKRADWHYPGYAALRSKKPVECD
jgi:hypothetical protein